MVAVVLGGGVCLLGALFNLPVGKIDLNFLLLFCFTIGLGSRVTVQIPKFKSHISVSDTFIFLALLLYGGEIRHSAFGGRGLFFLAAFLQQKADDIFQFRGRRNFDNDRSHGSQGRRPLHCRKPSTAPAARISRILSSHFRSLHLRSFSSTPRLPRYMIR